MLLLGMRYQTHINFSTNNHAHCSCVVVQPPAGVAWLANLDDSLLAEPSLACMHAAATWTRAACCCVGN